MYTSSNAQEISSMCASRTLMMFGGEDESTQDIANVFMMTLRRYVHSKVYAGSSNIASGTTYWLLNIRITLYHVRC